MRDDEGRVYHDYRTWEDWKAGMYSQSKNPTGHIEARRLLSDPARLEPAMLQAVMGWPISAEHNLTASGGNRRSWVGQAACFTVCGAVHEDTCAAWWLLSDPARSAANACADRVIKVWEDVTSDAQTLF